jgi:hypothetical protein
MEVKPKGVPPNLDFFGPLLFILLLILALRVGEILVVVWKVDGDSLFHVSLRASIHVAYGLFQIL